MLVKGGYHLSCQFVIPFLFRGLVDAEHFWALGGDKICQFAPIFASSRASS
jgi:hypothetical protein